MSIIYLNNGFVEDTGGVAETYSPFFYTGLGVFDSMLAIEGVPQQLEQHVARFKHDVEAVLGGSFSKIVPDNLEFLYKQILSKNNLLSGRARLRTTVVITETKDSLFIIFAGVESASDMTRLTCKVITDNPREVGNILENCKRLDYSRNLEARAKAQEHGADEAILVNTDGHIVCGATSNIFIEENGVLITPPLSDGVLAGVTRRNIIETRNAYEQSISPTRLKAADKIYLTNSFFGLRDVEKVI